MRAILWLLGLFALACGLSVVARANDAYALLVWAPWRVQIALNLLVFLAAIFFFLLYKLVRIGVRGMEMPGEVAEWRRRRKLKSALCAHSEAERFFYEGRYGQAFRRAVAAYEGGAAPGNAALLAARSAHAMRDTARRDTWLAHASAHDGETRIARLMTEAEMAVAERRFDEAAQRLEMLREAGHRHLAVMRLALQVEQGRGRWLEVARLARSLRKHEALSPEQLAPLLRRALVEQLRDAAGDLDALQRLWHDIPEAERLEPGFLQRAVPLLVEAGDQRLGLSAIEAALGREWDEELAALYGRCPGGELRERLGYAERWLKDHPEEPGLLLTLGRLCMQGQLWGKAQSYFEASLARQASRTAHLELAQLAEVLERPEQAVKHYREAAMLGARA